MDWIKANYEKAVLILLALILLAISGMLILNAKSFDQTFDAIRGAVTKNNNVPPPDMSGLQRASAELQKGAEWKSNYHGSLFVAEPYLVQEGKLIPFKGGPPLHPPVPNDWFIANKLDVLDTNILNEDPDGDGFNNLEEFNAKTDPQSRESHPPFIFKLRLVRFIQVPFRLKFASYDGDPKNPKAVGFQVNALDVKGAPSQFDLHIGDLIAGTKFKIIKFEFKESINQSTGEKEDVSEMTVQDTTNPDHTIVMPLNKIGDSPDSFGQFHYLIDNKDYRVKKGGTFSLPPDNQQYKLVDISQNEAQIESATGQKIKVTANDATLVSQQ
jgi:hypothetical protein